jgi:hypothetical protein
VKIKNKLGIKILGLVVFSLLLAVNCAKEGTAPEENIPPNTSIGPFSINNTPVEGTLYTTNLNWGGSDIDGAIYWYEWRIIADTGDSLYLYDYHTDENGDTVSVDTTNISNWQVGQSVSLSLVLDFPTWEYSYTFEVRAQDNDHAFDPTPVSLSISQANAGENTPPQTTIITGPPNGAATGPGIYFSIGGSDDNGSVVSIQYRVDDGDWVTLAAASNIANFIIRDLDVGARTIYFRSVDNYGAVDPTLVSVSVVVYDTFAPEIALNILDGQSFIVPFTSPEMEELAISFTATVDFYYGAIDSYIVVTSEGDDINTTESQFVFQNVGAGNYWIDVTAYDAGGGSTATGHINFSVVELPAGDGILCINGCDWSSYPQAVVMWDDGVPWGNREHFKCWDLFDTTPFGDVPDFTDSLLGTGSIPEWMFDTTFFDAISWFANAYSGDDAYWDERHDAIMSYLEMGGNILLPTRYGSIFFFDELATYTGIVADSWVSPGGDSLVAKVGILGNILVESAQSLWEIPLTDNPDNVWIYEAVNVAPDMQAGFVTLPNGNGGGGAFCYIAGRSYRWDNPSLKAAVDVIMETYFGITN